MNQKFAIACCVLLVQLAPGICACLEASETNHACCEKERTSQLPAEGTHRDCCFSAISSDSRLLGISNLRVADAIADGDDTSLGAGIPFSDAKAVRDPRLGNPTHVELTSVRESVLATRSPRGPPA